MQLYDKNKKSLFDLNVAKAFASGGEGSVCEHPKDKSKVVKAYHKSRDLSLESALVELKALGKAFVKPEEIYYDQSGKIAGFSMSYVDMSKYVVLKKLFNNSFCQQNGYDKKVKFKVYQNLKAAVEEAHGLGIYIGDLNPYNILVNLQGEVVMLDVDSFGTKSKPHNGVLLEDIRDWLQHPKVDTSTDQYAFDVLTFWMFTMCHPFRGDYPQHKTLEERVCKKSSLLSGLPITIPNCYQPFSNPDINKQFFQVFQDGKRYLVDLTGQPQILTATAVAQPQIVDSKSLFIRVIAQGVSRIAISDNQMAVLKDTLCEWQVFSVRDHGVFSHQYSVTDADQVFVGNQNVVYQKNGKLWEKQVQIKNVVLGHGLQAYSENGSAFLLSSMMDRYETLSVEDILNGNIMSSQADIFAKSLNFGDGCVWQNIGDKKWILDFKKTGFNIIKTDFNIKNAYKRKEYVLIEHLDGAKTRYTMCKINGLKLEVGCDFTEFRYFDVKQGFIFVPEDSKINLINPVNNWQIVSEIECGVCTFESRIYHTGAGMVIHTGDTVYLVNKK
jgi:serine/threonine protein kinase